MQDSFRRYIEGQQLRIQFKDQALLDRAFVDRSMEEEVGWDNTNAPLVYIGASILQLAARRIVAAHFKGSLKTCEHHDTMLTRAVRVEWLCSLLGWDTILTWQPLTAKSAYSSAKIEDRRNSRLVSAVIGAVAEDQGLEAAVSCMEQLWAPYVDTIFEEPREKTAVEKLEEWYVTKFGYPPAYRMYPKGGKANRTFRYSVNIPGLGLRFVTDPSKREAKRKLAEACLAEIESTAAKPAV